MGLRRKSGGRAHIVALVTVFALGAAGIPLSASSAHAAVPASIEAGRKSVVHASAAWDDAKRDLAQTSARFETLEHRITALKHLRTKAPSSFGADAELDRLLRETIEAEAALKAASREVDARASDVKKRAHELVGPIDARIKELTPSLNPKRPIAERKAAARAINELREVRRELAMSVARLSESDADAVPREWERYKQEIDPDDDALRLGEKADAVEDVRDRFRKKRDELLRLLRDAREEQDVLRAAADFRTDVGLFDEEARSGRVVKQASGEALSLGGSDQNKAGGDPQSPAPVGVSDPSGRGDHEASPPPPQAGFGGSPTQPAPAPPVDDVLAEDVNRNPQSPSRTETGGGGGAQPRAAENPLLAKQVDPNVLLNLRIEALAGKGVDVATLESLVANLDKLDQFLAGRANEIRGRAKQLKADEARALGKTK